MNTLKDIATFLAGIAVGILAMPVLIVLYTLIAVSL